MIRRFLPFRSINATGNGRPCRCHCFLVVGLIVLLITLVSGSVAQAAPRIPRRESLLERRLVLQKQAWPHPLAKAFVEKLPSRIAEPLHNQLPDALPFFVTRAEMPGTQRHPHRKTICLASVGYGGSYVAVFRQSAGDYVRLWDTLMPPSFMSPTIKLRDLDHDSAPEIICSGQLLDTTLHEWAIIRWKNERGYLMVPRMDRRAPSLRYNRLIGDSLAFIERADNMPLIKLTINAAPAEHGKRRSSPVVRVFRYNSTLDGFLPADGESQPPTNR